MDEQVIPALDGVDVELDDLSPALQKLAERGQTVGRRGAGPGQ